METKYANDNKFARRTEPSFRDISTSKNGAQSNLAIPINDVESQGSSFRINAPDVEIMSLRTGVNEPLETM